MTPRNITQLLGLAVLVRAIVVAISFGTNDVFLWRLYAQIVERVGLLHAWNEDPYLNHPPLTLGWATLCYLVSGTSLYGFCILMKLPGLIGDLLAIWLLWRMAKDNGSDEKSSIAIASIYAFNPLAILISAYHGNTDSLMAALLLGAFWLATRERMLLAGLVLGAAINVKLAPVPCVLMLLLATRSWRDFARCIAGLAIAAVPFIPPLVVSFDSFAKNVLSYLPLGSAWGLMLPMVVANENPHWAGAAQFVRQLHEHATRYVIFGLAIVLGWMTRKRRLDTLTAGAIFWCFLVAWTSAAVQYLVWPLPLLVAVRPRLAWWYGIAAAVYVGWQYLERWTWTVPMVSQFTIEPNYASRWAGLLPWAMLFAACVVLCRKRLSRDCPTTPCSPATASE